MCAPSSCVAGVATAASWCNAAGTCQKPEALSCLPYACTSGGAPACKSTCYAKDDCEGGADCFGGICGGLKGTYFATKSLMGRSIERIDRNIDFAFGSGPPEPTMPNDLFSIRWTGKITPPATGLYTLYTESDDGVAVWVNGQMIISQWQIQSLAGASGQIQLNGGAPVSLKLEYFDDHGDGAIRLLWSGPSFTKQVVPVNVLKP
ncbi:MAG TPA: PA14 domain-containing protein [Polyangia bacterium]